MSRGHLLWLFVAACGRGPAPVASPAPSNAVVAPSADAAMPTFSLADADCRALATAQVLGVAVVVSSVPDCSGIGHARIVLEVQQLARGAAIQTVVTSRPLHGVDEGPRFREGDTVVISIAAAKEPARTVSCVPLPASDGTVSHAVSVEDTDEGRRMLAAIVDGRCYASP